MSGNEIIAAARDAGRQALSEDAGKALLTEFGIAVPRSVVPQGSHHPLQIGRLRSRAGCRDVQSGETFIEQLLNPVVTVVQFARNAGIQRRARMLGSATADRSG